MECEAPVIYDITSDLPVQNIVVIRINEPYSQMCGILLSRLHPLYLHVGIILSSAPN